MKLTKQCFFPWEYRIVHAGGLMCPCCAIHDTDYGDYIIDYIEVKKRGEEPEDVFNNDAVKNLKKGLLTGKLHPMCQKCSLVPQKLIPIEEFKENLEQEFDRLGVGYKKGSDYSEVDAVKRAGIGNTNKCNLRCIYCNQSVLAEKNPYFKADFPENELFECLEQLAQKGITLLETGAFGEATLHPKWGEIFWKFHKKYPEIELSLTTNLSKKYSDSDIELLAEHKYLRVSLETLDEKLFSEIRVNGKLPLILENLNRIEKVMDEKGYSHDRIAISSVICNITWESIREVSRFSFEHGFAYHACAFEPRENSIGIKNGILKAIRELDIEQKEKIKQILLDVQIEAKKCNGTVLINEELFESSGMVFNQFENCENNPIYNAFRKKYPLGNSEMFLGVEFDYLYNQYTGIMLKNDKELILELDTQDNVFEYREISIYKNGKVSEKYGQRVVPDYRKIMKIDKIFTYRTKWENEDIEYVLLQIINWWKE